MSSGVQIVALVCGTFLVTMVLAVWNSRSKR